MGEKEKDDTGKAAAERQTDYRKRQSELGNVQTVLWLPADTLQAMHALKDKCGGSRESVVVEAVKALQRLQAQGRAGASNDNDIAESA